MCNLGVGETDLRDVSLNSYVIKSDVQSIKSNFNDTVLSNISKTIRL